MTIPRDHGYYTSHGRRVSKITANRFFNKTGIAPIYNLFEEEIAAVDLFIEPTASLQELYARRAREIREKYDYVILAFSGGTDSECVFRAFYENGIRIDEILHYHYDLNYKEKLIRMKIATEEYEHERLSIPLIKFIKDNLCPDIEVTISDYTKTGMDFFQRMGANWHEQMDEETLLKLVSPGMIWRADPSILNPKWQKMLDSGKKVALVAGKEKLQIDKDQTGWYWQYQDNSYFRWQMPPIQRIDAPMSIEMFFTAPSTVDLQLKQAHAIRNATESHHILLDRSKLFSRLWENTYAKICYGKRLLPLPFLAFKEPDYTERYGTNYVFYGAGVESLFFVREQGEVWNQNWKRGMQDVYKHLLYDDLKADDLIIRGIRTDRSKKHYFARNEIDV